MLTSNITLGCLLVGFHSIDLQVICWMHVWKLWLLVWAWWIFSACSKKPFTSECGRGDHQQNWVVEEWGEWRQLTLMLSTAFGFENSDELCCSIWNGLLLDLLLPLFLSPVAVVLIPARTVVRQVTIQHFILEETPATGLFGHLQLFSRAWNVWRQMIVVMKNVPHRPLCDSPQVCS